MSIRKVIYHTEKYIPVIGCETVAICLRADPWELRTVSGLPYVYATIENSGRYLGEGGYSYSLSLFENPRSEEVYQYTLSYDDTQLLNDSETSLPYVIECSDVLSIITDTCLLSGIEALYANQQEKVIRCIWSDFNSIRTVGAAPATAVVNGFGGAWEFADNQDQNVVFNLKIPTDVDLTEPISVGIGWSTPVVDDTLFARWQLEYLFVSEGDDTTQAAQDVVTLDSNALTQANGFVLAEIPALDLIDSDDVFMQFRLTRLSSADDLGDVAHLHGVCINYVSDKRGTPI